MKKSTDRVRPAYATTCGRMYQGLAENLLDGDLGKDLRGKVQLIFTSPPFPLNTKKRYGNLNGQKYVEWLASFGTRFRDLMTDTGSVVVEIGNAWEPSCISSCQALTRSKRSRLL